MSKKNLYTKYTILLCFVFFAKNSLAQKIDSIKHYTHFSGVATVTNNGISLVPSFSLGKPAILFNLKMAKNKFSFEPDIRFSLAAKPWAFLFWFRYNLIKKNNFLVKIGAHPALNFKEQTVLINGNLKNVIIARRYFATEISPNYIFNKNNSIGIYYLHSNGLDDGTIKSTHFVTLNYALSNIKINEQFFLNFVPQFYYLKLDANDGIYFTSTFTVKKIHFPLSISSIINKTIHTNIVGNKFLWNISLNYAFN